MKDFVKNAEKFYLSMYVIFTEFSWSSLLDINYTGMMQFFILKNLPTFSKQNNCDRLKYLCLLINRNLYPCS